jgi:prepilin-type N-terminal cleavage/methylation domain-containing protein
MVSLKNRSKGFTIIELLIVIVVIAILATLVIVTFTGIQQKARNSQRQTDINAVDTHVEGFYAQWGFYPGLADLQTPAFVSKYMKGLDPQAFVDPKGPTKTIGVTAAADQYSYVPQKAGAACTPVAMVTTGDPIDTGCDSFTLTAKLEGDADYVKQSN